MTAPPPRSVEPSPGPPAAAPTSALAVIAFVLAFTVPPGAIVCGHVALAQLRRSGEQGRGFALAATIMGWVFTALIVLFVVLWFVVFFGIFAVVLGTAATIPDATPTPF